MASMASVRDRRLPATVLKRSRAIASRLSFSAKINCHAKVGDPLLVGVGQTILPKSDIR